MTARTTFTVPITTDGDGNAIGFTQPFSGHVESIHYVKDGTNGFATGVDFTITAEATGEVIWNENDVNSSAVRRPRAATHTTAGAAALYAGGGAAVLDRIALGRDRVKVSVASGGANKVGTFIIVVGE